jgi:tartrate dehydratase beta subunit/fumarate hydratase class I family protein
MDEAIRIQTPLTDEIVEKLKIGDKALVSGFIYTGRDAAHKRLVELVNRGQPLPFDIKGQIIYYVGPTRLPTQGRSLVPQGLQVATGWIPMRPSL